jgi:hypothetical protein
MKTTLLTPELVSENWHLIKGPLTESLKHGVGESTVTDYLKRVLNFQAQVWIFTEDDGTVKGVGLTQFINYSQHRTLHIIACSGDGWAGWADQYYVVEKFAKDNGCRAVEQWGRPGWSKVLPKAIPGFETVYHVMRKEIT